MHHRPCRRVLAHLLGRGRQRQHLGRIDVRRRLQFGHIELPRRQCTGLVKHHRRNFARDLQQRNILDQNAQPSRCRQRRHHRRRRRQNQRTRTRNHQRRNRAGHIFGKEIDDQADHQNRRNVPLDVLVDHPHDRQLRLLGGHDQLLHLPQRRILSGLGHFDIQHARQVGRSRKHHHPYDLIDRQRFAGDGRLVNRTQAACDLPVSGNIVARPHPHHIPRGQCADLDLHFAAFGGQPMRRRRRQLDQRFDRRPRPQRRARLQQFGQQHNKRHRPGLDILADGKRGNDRQRHQFVHVHMAVKNPFNGMKNNRQTQQNRSDQRHHPAQIMTGRPIQPGKDIKIHKNTVENQHPARQRPEQRQADAKLLVFHIGVFGQRRLIKFRCLDL